MSALLWTCLLLARAEEPDAGTWVLRTPDRAHWYLLPLDQQLPAGKEAVVGACGESYRVGLAGLSAFEVTAAAAELRRYELMVGAEAACLNPMLERYWARCPTAGPQAGAVEADLRALEGALASHSAPALSRALDAWVEKEGCSSPAARALPEAVRRGWAVEPAPKPATAADKVAPKELEDAP